MVFPDDSRSHPEKSHLNRTGEDIDMLREQKSDPESNDQNGSTSYKDNYDAA
jgi:hypothetical protein